MFDIAFKRLVWKELRTQWHIWAALVIGAFLLQMLCLFPELRIGSDYPFYVGLVLTCCYSVTCGGILFAGEREEQTDDWLRQLPMSSNQMIAGKAIFLTTSVVAFLLVAATAAVFLGSFSPAQRYEPYMWSDQWDMTQWFVNVVIGLTVWSVFYSLLLSRVMSVLLASTMTFLVVSGIIDNFMPDPTSTWMGVAAVIVAVADVWLAKQWLLGRSVVPAFEGNRVTTDRRSRAWLRGVTWAATQTPLALRTFAVLIWRELRGAVPFAIGWGLLGVLMVDVSVRVWGPSGRFNGLWLIPTPLFCGLMTCAGDNWRQTFRFVTDRGLNPLTIWLTKHIVWLTLAVGLVLLFGVYDVVTGDRAAGNTSSEVSVWNGLGTAPNLGDRHHTANYDAGYRAELARRKVSMFCSLGLLMYAVGHLCSLWFRRMAVAFSVATVVGVMIFISHIFVGVMDIPFLRTTWPLVLMMLLASLVTIGGWLRESSNWRRVLLQVAFVALPLWGAYAAATHWRATQVPMVAVPFDWEQRARTMTSADSAWSGRWQQLFADLRLHFPDEAEYERRRRTDLFGATAGADAAEVSTNDVEGKPADGGELDVNFEQAPAGGSMESSGGSFRSNRWDNLLNKELRGFEILTELRALARDIEPNRTIHPRVLSNTPIQEMRLTGAVIVEAAYQTRKQGDLDEAWAILKDGLKVTEYLSTQAINTHALSACWSARRMIHQEIHIWAADKDQTVERLQTAADEFASLTIELSSDEMWKNRYAYMRSMLENWEYISPDGQRDGPYHSSLVSTKSERQRTIRLMSAITTGLLSQESHQAEQTRYPSNWHPYVSDEITPPNLQRWEATTSLLPPDFHVGHQFPILEPVTRTEAATPVILRLQMFRVEHGTLPDTLSEALEDVDNGSRIGTTFGYAPKGLSKPAMTYAGRGIDDDEILPPHTPMLWTPASTQFVQAEDGAVFIAASVLNSTADLDRLKRRARELAPFDATETASDEALPRPLVFVVIGYPLW